MGVCAVGTACIILRRSSPTTSVRPHGLALLQAAELFVVLSGFVLGMVHHKRVKKEGWKCQIWVYALTARVSRKADLDPNLTLMQAFV